MKKKYTPRTYPMNLDRGINPIGCGGTRCPNMAHRVVLSSSVESHMALFPSLTIFALVNSGVFLHRKDNNAKKYTPRRYPTGQSECGSPDGLFICSFGAVNCADCMQFIRKATKEELGIADEKKEA